MNPAGRFFAHASLVLAPLLYLQGAFTRLRIAKLGEAGGACNGATGQGTHRLRLLVIGESTAAGVGAATHNDGLVGQVALAIHDMTGAAVDWQVLAANGLTAAGLRARLPQLPPDSRADLIVIGLGANDVFRLQGPMGWERDLRALIDALRERCGFAPVMISAMPPIGQFPGLPQPLRAVLGLRAQMLDDVTRKLAARMTGVHFVALDFEADAALFADDGIHPSAAGYSLWGRAVAGAALDHLPRRG